jgi:hypothetical protein
MFPVVVARSRKKEKKTREREERLNRSCYCGAFLENGGVYCDECAYTPLEDLSRKIITPCM